MVKKSDLQMQWLPLTPGTSWKRPSTALDDAGLGDLEVAQLGDGRFLMFDEDGRAFSRSRSGQHDELVDRILMSVALSLQMSLLRTTRPRTTGS